MIGVYVHIPFCASKCVYCAFSSFVTDEEEKARYFDHLCKEIESCSFSDNKVKTIYFGGGTPSVVSENYIERVIASIRKRFDLSCCSEMTIECNPCSVTESKLKFYRRLGFNRISFGVQSLNDDALKFLGRRHNSHVAFASIKLAKQAGFENISADLLLGIKNTDIVCDAKKLLDLGIKHISAYMLQVEEGTPLEKMQKLGTAQLQSEDETIENYQKLNQFLQKNGLKRYEISNFALPGYQSEHNKGYWNSTPYLGFGLGAHSFDGKFLRWANAANFKDYYAGKMTKEHLSKKERDEEVIMLGLRCDMGFDKKKLSFDISQKGEYKQFVKQGILIEEKDVVKLNEEYYGVSNTIIEKLI